MHRAECLLFSLVSLLKNRSFLRIGNMFPRSEKAGLFPIFERRKIVQKLRKTSYFLTAIVDIAFLMRSQLFKALSGIYGKVKKKEFHQCPAGKLRPFPSYSWPFKLHSHSNSVAASVLLNKCNDVRPFYAMDVWDSTNGFKMKYN